VHWYRDANRGEYLFVEEKTHLFSRNQVEDPKGTPGTLSLERLISLDIFERGEQVINQQEIKKSDPNEGFQSHEEGQ
jgi:hypothetical protein